MIVFEHFSGEAIILFYVFNLNIKIRVNGECYACVGKILVSIAYIKFKRNDKSLYSIK